jgi:hypothetical protein
MQPNGGKISKLLFKVACKQISINTYFCILKINVIDGNFY